MRYRQLFCLVICLHFATISIIETIQIRFPFVYTNFIVLNRFTWTTRPSLIVTFIIHNNIFLLFIHYFTKLMAIVYIIPKPANILYFHNGGSSKSNSSSVRRIDSQAQHPQFNAAKEKILGTPISTITTTIAM